MSTDLQAPPEWDRLLAASQKNLPETIRTLITEEGVDPSHSNRVGQTALHIASIWGHVESVEVLLELGANINAANQITGATPLHCAVQSSKAADPEHRVTTVQMLLEAGADPSRGDFFGSIPLDYLEEDDDERLTELLQPGDVPAVFEAIQSRDYHGLESLLKEDPTVAQSRYKDLTPLLEVVRLLLDDNTDDPEFVELLQLLLENGADPDDIPTLRRQGHLMPQEPAGDASLHQVCLAIKNAYSSGTQVESLKRAARLLKEHNATVTPDTQQLLHDAARRNNVELLTFLLDDIGVSPNARGRQGMTALQFAARSGKKEAVELLLAQEGIDVNIKDDRGQTALDAARVNSKDDIVALLEEHVNTTTE